MGRRRNWDDGKPIRTRNLGSNFRDGGLKKIEVAEIDKGQLVRKLPKGALYSCLPYGTEADTVNLYRYIRLIAYKEAKSVERWVKCPIKDLPIDKITLDVMNNLLDDIDYMIASQVDTEMMDRGILNLGGKDGEE